MNIFIELIWLLESFGKHIPSTLTRSDLIVKIIDLKEIFSKKIETITKVPTRIENDNNRKIHSKPVSPVRRQDNLHTARRASDHSVKNICSTSPSVERIIRIPNKFINK